jgi:hypothetical protein
MDSCYPCDGSAYTLLDKPIVGGTEKVFGGWLKTGNVVVVNAQSPGTTVTLTPIEQTIPTQANQTIQIPIAPVCTTWWRLDGDWGAMICKTMEIRLWVSSMKASTSPRLKKPATLP